MRVGVLLIALLALPSLAQRGGGRFDRFNSRCDQGRSDRGFACDDFAFFELAPSNSVGLGAACSGTATGVHGETIASTRGSSATCSTRGRATTGFAPGDIINLSTNVIRTEPNSAGQLAIRGEPAGTNLSLRSDAFDTAPWQAINSTVSLPTITANQALSPANVLEADRVQVAACPAVGNYSLVIQFQATAFKVTPATISLWVRGNGSNGAISLYADDGATGYDVVTCNYNASTWSICELPSTQGDLVEWGFGCLNVAAGGSNTGAADFFVWSGQLENSAYRSNPIPTSGAAATRALEAVTTSAVNLAALTSSGCAAATFEPFATTAAVDVLIGGNDARYLYLSPSLRTFDGVNNPALASGFVAGTPKRYRTTWAASTMDLFNVTDATSTSSAFDGAFTPDGTLRFFGAVIGQGPGYLSSLQLDPTPARCQ